MSKQGCETQLLNWSGIIIDKQLAKKTIKSVNPINQYKKISHTILIHSNLTELEPTAAVDIKKCAKLKKVLLIILFGYPDIYQNSFIGPLGVV